MAPLVPDFINDELNLLVALLVGIAFGWVLEQAGFSSSRKLTGLFYGTDFTVLRVFFTAGVTAMAGVLICEQLGWLDPEAIFVNPLFVQSAIVGGLIMGVGFVVGGYCPGTSVVAAAVGRVDAMVFVGGSLVGIFAFGEAYPWVEGLYKAGAQGDLLISSALGLTTGQFALGLIVMAVGAFVGVGVIEKRVNPETPIVGFPKRPLQAAAALVLVVGVALALTPERRERLMAQAAREAGQVAVMADDELALRVLDRDSSIEIVDVREAPAFAKATLPGAVGVPLKNLFGKDSRALLESPTKKVLLGADEASSRQAAALARLLGAQNVAAVEGGMRGFTARILEAKSGEGVAARFRAEAAPKILAMMRERGAAKPAKAPRRVQGGCGS